MEINSRTSQIHWQLHTGHFIHVPVMQVLHGAYFKFRHFVIVGPVKVQNCSTPVNLLGNTENVVVICLRIICVNRSIDKEN